MPPVMTSSRVSAAIWSMESQRMTLPSAPRTPGTSVRKTSASALQAHGAGGGHLVGVDVVVLAVEAERDAGDDGHGAHLPDGIEPARIGGSDFADEAEVGSGALFAGAKDEAVAAGKSDGGLAVRAERGDQRLVDAAAEHHQRGVARFGIGDAQAGRRTRSACRAASRVRVSCAPPPWTMAT